MLKDTYLESRKGYSQIYNLYCSKCKTPICEYQKDGIGDLKRIYLDRIKNEELKKDFTIDKKLTCPTCHKLLGLGYIYEKENRPAYKLFANEINIKAKSKIKYIYYSIIRIIIGEV